MISLVLLLSLLGWVLNLAFSTILIQPDWSMALLLGALLAHRGSWPWVSVAVWLHDLVLHWSSFVSLPWMLLAPLFLLWSDAEIGPSLMQRCVVMIGVITPLWFWGWSFQACLLTLMLCVVVWYWVARSYAQPA